MLPAARYQASILNEISRKMLRITNLFFLEREEEEEKQFLLLRNCLFLTLPHLNNEDDFFSTKRTANKLRVAKHTCYPAKSRYN